jgi:hypothetical protein
LDSFVSYEENEVCEYGRWSLFISNTEIFKGATWGQSLAVSAPWGVELYEDILVGLDQILKVGVGG